jgi:hypothetical protein
LASRRAPQSLLERARHRRAIAEFAASTGADIAIIDILDPLAHETAVAIVAFIVDRPQP